MIVDALLNVLEKRRGRQAKQARASRLAPTPEEREALDAARIASYPGAYPTGWVPLVPIDELGDKPLSVNTQGRSLVVFRTASGAIHVMDAFCPHLGAHLALGHVCGENLTCRFHGWQFSGAGEVVSVPYGKRSPARVGVHPSEVYYGMLCAFVGPTGLVDEAPYALGRVPEIDDGRFTYRGSHDAHDVRMNLLEFAENSADVQHFAHLHDQFRIPWTQVPVPGVGLAHRATWRKDEAEPHVCWFENEAIVTWRGKRIEGRGGKARVRFDGPGTVIRFELDLGERGTIVLFQFHTPKNALRQHVRFRWFAERHVPDGLARFVVGHWISQWEQDLEIWETKAYRPQPSLVAEDGPVVAMRRWVQQFYA
ncbi:MAG: Rieske 2Fe-2S domain-containing protein [Myxococcales bacterium]|nr:Rieske 2Fe-2S domain-containing protein [Myxococcales bacterium]